MFSFAVKYLRFLKECPLLPQLFDCYLKLLMLITHPGVLDHIDDLETEFLTWDDASTSLHKYGGSQFNYRGKEIAHIHSNGVLSILFNRKIKEQLMKEERISHHYVYADSGWVSFYILKPEDVDYAKRLLKMAYLKMHGTQEASLGSAAALSVYH